MPVKPPQEKEIVPTKIQTNIQSDRSPDVQTNKGPEKPPVIQIDLEPSQFPPLSSNTPVSYFLLTILILLLSINFEQSSKKLMVDKYRKS